MYKTVDQIIAEFIEDKKQSILYQLEQEREKEDNSLWYNWGLKIMSRYE